ncbi:MAG TPA: DUF4234 domain-containing protein [candidate division Zixibacteria bacterium]
MRVKKRNLVAQVLLAIVTFGIYTIYWFHQTATELKGLGNDASANPTLWTVMLFIPIANIFAMYRYCELYEKVSSDKMNKWLTFLLWIVFSPAVWFIVQTELNRRATA